MGEQRDPAAAAPKATDWQDEHTDALDDLDRVAMLRGLRRLDAMRRALRPDGSELEPLPDPEPLAPELGDDYRVERLLGIGGMGAVWLARWRQDDVERDVAVKVLLAGRDSTVAAQRFQRERRILARLQHPGIARLLDVGSTTDGRLFLSMEYIAGHLLQEHVRQHRPDIATRLRLLVEIADAVGFAHRHFVVHRDLKPLNVVVDGDGHAHLLDFGIARLLGDSDEETLTRTGVRPLSPGYAAPEQLRGDDVGVAADIYALGVIGYELLCGVRPFDRQGGLERILRDLGSERLRPPSEQVATTRGDDALRPPLPARRLARELRGDLDTILMRALATHPERRYATASDFADDLRRYLDGRPIRARPDSAWYRMRKFAARHRSGVAIASSALVALVIGLAVALAQARRANVERDRALAARDFLLGMVQSANPYQAPNPSLRVDLMFERAAATLSGRFPDDPEMEAQLLQQFGRSLMILERGAASEAALERAQALLVGRVADTHPLLIEVRSRLVDLYRLRRDLDRADQLANQQFALCERETALPALTCLGVRNDRIETALALGRPADAVDRIAEARGFADRGGLQGDYEAVFLDYLAGMALRQLGRSDEAAQAFIHLAERSLRIVPAQHPGLLTDTMWFGWIALDLGDAELATRCAEIALTGRLALYAPWSRYVHEARLLRAQVAFVSGDTSRARAEYATILDSRPPAGDDGSSQLQLARTWLRWLDGDTDTSGPVPAPGVDDRMPRAIEMRLLQRALAARRGEGATATSDLDNTLAASPYWQPLAWSLDAHVARNEGRDTDADAIDARIEQELLRQQRRLYDPFVQRWRGAAPAAATERLQTIRALVTRIAETRARAH